MGAFAWYDTTPTIISTDSDVTYINFPAELLPDDEATREWAAVAAEEGVPVRVPVQRDELTGECVALTVAEFAAVEAEEVTTRGADLGDRLPADNVV